MKMLRVTLNKPVLSPWSGRMEQTFEAINGYVIGSDCYGIHIRKKESNNSHIEVQVYDIGYVWVDNTAVAFSEPLPVTLPVQPPLDFPDIPAPRITKNALQALPKSPKALQFLPKHTKKTT